MEAPASAETHNPCRTIKCPYVVGVEGSGAAHTLTGCQAWQGVGVAIRQLDRAIADRHTLAVLADAEEAVGGARDGDVERRVAGLLGERDRLTVEPGVLARVALI